ncbi:MAG: hydroxymethylglutaryl-CoA lyase [Bacteroidota bacterium]
MKIIECPRDAMQGLHDFIPTDTKARYLNTLLQVGFDALDFGSFVSPKAIPQMRDTAEVLGQLNLSNTDTKLLAIVANKRGALNAASFAEVDVLGYPFSISETFQLRNTNATIEESLERVKVIQEICLQHNKTLLIYISMGFGNPYGDIWNVEIVQNWVEKLIGLGITIFQLSDTIGVAEPANIQYLFSHLIPANPTVEIGAHFHTTPDTWEEKVVAAYDSGCRRFDGTIRGFGGCPMAQNKLVGNMPSEQLIAFARGRNLEIGLDLDQYWEGVAMANEILK